MKKIIVNSLLTVATLIVSLLLMELVARTMQSTAEVGELFLSPASIVAGEDGAIHYRPSSKIRARTTYGGVVEYDVTFATNNFGSIDSVDYSSGGNLPGVAVVGDSFTAGYQGGAPWVPRLRGMPELAGREVYNLGVEGVSSNTYLANLRRASLSLNFDTVLVVAISSSFFRPTWRPVEAGDRLWFCGVGLSSEECQRSTATARIFTEDGDAMLIPPPPQLPSPWAASYWIGDMAPAKLWIISLFPALVGLEHNARNAIRISSTGQAKAGEFFRDLAAWGAGKHLIVLFLPTADEVARGSFPYQLDNVAAQYGVTYASGFECGLVPGDFLVNDHHPNAVGYDKVRKCAAKAIARAR